ncbi:MAG: hypothetical protein WCU88_11420 [Elusimicrobiota bacterium]|jgi:hypothetical protein
MAVKLFFPAAALALCLAQGPAAAAADPLEQASVSAEQGFADVVRAAKKISKPKIRAKIAPEKANVRVTDAESWSRLLARARAFPDRRMVVSYGEDAGYEVFVLTSTRPILGQECRKGGIENSFFMSRPLGGSGQDVYPGRISALCRVSGKMKDLLSVAIDGEGMVQDVALRGGGFDLPRSAGNRRAPAPRALEEFLRKMVVQFLAAD